MCRVSLIGSETARCQEKGKTRFWCDIWPYCHFTPPKQHCYGHSSRYSQLASWRTQQDAGWLIFTNSFIRWSCSRWLLHSILWYAAANSPTDYLTFCKGDLQQVQCWSCLVLMLPTKPTDIDSPSSILLASQQQLSSSHSHTALWRTRPWQTTYGQCIMLKWLSEDMAYSMQYSAFSLGESLRWWARFQRHFLMHFSCFAAGISGKTLLPSKWQHFKSQKPGKNSIKAGANMLPPYPLPIFRPNFQKCMPPSVRDSMSYRERTWLVYKERFVAASLHNNRHYGHVTTSRVECPHAILKKWIFVLTGKLYCMLIELARVICI